MQQNAWQMQNPFLKCNTLLNVLWRDFQKDKKHYLQRKLDFFLKSSTFPHVDFNLQSSELNPSENNHNGISKPLMIGSGTHAWLVFWLNHRSEEFTWISSTFLILKHPSYSAEDLLKRSRTSYSIFYMRYVYKKDKRRDNSYK